MSYTVHIVEEFDVEQLPTLKHIPATSTVCLGGSFDRIHRGHLLLIATAIACVRPCGKLLIGIADGPLLTKKLYTGMVRDYAYRANDVRSIVESYACLRPELLELIKEDELSSRGASRVSKPPPSRKSSSLSGPYAASYSADSYFKRTLPSNYRLNIDVKAFSIYDPYGPSITEALTDGLLVVSTETLIGGHMVNIERQRLGLRPIQLVVVPLLRDDLGEKVSSGRLREEESLSETPDVDAFVPLTHGDSR